MVTLRTVRRGTIDGAALRRTALDSRTGLASRSAAGAAAGLELLFRIRIQNTALVLAFCQIEGRYASRKVYRFLE